MYHSLQDQLLYSENIITGRRKHEVKLEERSDKAWRPKEKEIRNV